MGLGRWLLGMGLALVVLGLAWPWLSRLGLGRLPGDIVIARGQSRVYLPLATCVLVSAVANLVLWLFRR